MNWKERLEDISLIPWDLYHQFLCKVLDRCHTPIFGFCITCGKELGPGDYISWTERLDPDNWAHSFLMGPEPMIRMMVQAKYDKGKRDAEYFYMEAHK